MKLLRMNQALDLQGISKSAFYDNIKQGLMTPPAKLGGASVWPEKEIRSINAAYVAGKSDTEIKNLVKKLIADRQNSEVAA